MPMDCASASLPSAISGAFINVAYFDLYYIYIAMAAILSRELRAIKNPVLPTVDQAKPVAVLPLSVSGN